MISLLKKTELLTFEFVSENKELKALHINDLYNSLVKGTIKFFKSDILKEKDCLKRMNEHYGKLSAEDLIKYNDSFK